MDKGEKSGTLKSIIPALTSIVTFYITFKHLHFPLGLVGASSFLVFTFLYTVLLYDSLKQPQKVAFVGLAISSTLLVALFGYDHFISNINITILNILGLVFPPILLGHYLLRKQEKQESDKELTSYKQEKDAPKPSSVIHKIFGGVSFLMGLGFIIFWQLAQKPPVTSKMDFDLSIAIKICMVLGGAMFIVLGVLMFMGKIEPYNLSQDKFNKVKIDLLGAIFFLPICITFTVVAFVYSESTAWKVVLSLLVIGVSWHLFDSIQTYRKYKKSPPVEEIQYD